MILTNYSCAQTDEFKLLALKLSVCFELTQESKATVFHGVCHEKGPRIHHSVVPDGDAVGLLAAHTSGQMKATGQGSIPWRRVSTSRPCGGKWWMVVRGRDVLLNGVLPNRRITSSGSLLIMMVVPHSRCSCAWPTATT